MQNLLTKENQSVPYSVKVSRRARRMRISVGRDAGVVVTLPWGIKYDHAEQFVRQKRDWILKSLNYFEKFKSKIFIRSPHKDYIERRREALTLAKEKVKQWNYYYNFPHRKISVKNQKTRWGSCSKKGNLNFNYKIVRLPENLVDYLVVHELCHLKEFNHSKNFWALVGQTIPEYKKFRKDLKNPM